MKRYEGKTLLVLGSNVGAADIVRYAKEDGALVLVADWYPVEKSRAKQLCDHAFEVSTTDTSALKKIVRDYHVDGILAGISGLNLNQARRLSESFGMPFYFSKGQWDAINTKNGFRHLCKKYLVPCPKTYYIGSNIDNIPWDDICYPIVVKPVDASSSTGVYFCSNRAELYNAALEDLKLSKTGSIIIEDMIRGEEFTAHFTIHNGIATLSCADNRVPAAVHEGAVTTIPIIRFYPSTYVNAIKEQLSVPIASMCAGIGLSEGVMFVQGIYEKETGNISVFEAGLRSAAESPYRFIEPVNGINYIRNIIDYSLSVESEYEFEKEDPLLRGKIAAVYSFIARGGTVGSIRGLEEAVSQTSSVIDYENRYPVGSTTPDGDTLRQIMMRFVMVCDSMDSLKKDIDFLNSSIDVYDIDGREMVIKLNASQLESKMRELKCS